LNWISIHLMQKRRRTKMSDGGKGSKPRPIPDRKKFEENWDTIFKPKPKKEEKSESSTQTAPAMR